MTSENYPRDVTDNWNDCTIVDVSQLCKLVAELSWLYNKKYSYHGNSEPESKSSRYSIDCGKEYDIYDYKIGVKIASTNHK